MNEILQACSIQEIRVEDEWIHIFPAGISMGHDGRGPYNLNDPVGVIATSYRPKVDLMIDRDHAIDLLPKGTPVKAAGWIKELQNREDGIWARVEWTPAAQAELAAKEYRYISPTFTFDKKSGVVIRILRASLTNNPNLELTAVAAAGAEDSSQQNEEETTMNKHLLALAAALALTNPASEEAIVTAAKEKLADIENLQTELASVKEALGLQKDADAKTAVATASALVERGDADDVDPSKFVPMAAHKELASQLSALQKTIGEDKATAAVDAAIKAGKISPAQKDWAIGYASKDLEDFNNFVESAPVIVTAGSGSGGDKERGTQGKSPQLDDQQTALCSQLGLDPEDFAKARAGEEKTA